MNGMICLNPLLIRAMIPTWEGFDCLEYVES